MDNFLLAVVITMMAYIVVDILSDVSERDRAQENISVVTTE